MTAPNHIVGGFVFTGVFSAILNTNLISDPLLIGVCVVASLLPDIDHPSTLLGRCLPFLSKFINDRYGHRTITHSLVFFLVCVLVVSFLNSILLIDGLVTVFSLAMFSHLLFDMMTVSGVSFLYPFSKILFVMPANPDYRFRVNDRSSEMMILAFFLFSGFTMKPLLETGFWTQYNSLFGTIQHLRSEFAKSDDLLDVTIKLRNGSKTNYVKGLVVGFSGEQVVIYSDREKLLRVPSLVERIDEIDMIHSGLEYTFLPVDPTVKYDRTVMIGVVDSLTVYDFILSNDDRIIWTPDLVGYYLDF